jgi:hypothetical protein
MPPNAPTDRWIRSFYASFVDGQDKPPVVGSVMGRIPVAISGPAPKVPKPTTPPPSLPTGCEITSQERVLLFTRKDDLSPTEMIAARAWLNWRWIPGWRPSIADLEAVS